MAYAALTRTISRDRPKPERLLSSPGNDERKTQLRARAAHLFDRQLLSPVKKAKGDEMDTASSCISIDHR
jgi:hypothetical protein